MIQLDPTGSTWAYLRAGTPDSVCLYVPFIRASEFLYLSTAGVFHVRKVADGANN